MLTDRQVSVTAVVLLPRQKTSPRGVKSARTFDVMRRVLNLTRVQPVRYVHDFVLIYSQNSNVQTAINSFF